MGRDSADGIATRYRLDSPGIQTRWGARFAAPVQTGCGVPGLPPGVQRPGRGVDHPRPSNAEVNGRVELYLYSTSRPSWHVLR